ncbi:MAG: helix-turn-helix transcriptional regulator [Clostridia bacterium]
MKNLFKERLKELRREKGLLQQDLAKELNVSKSAVSGWEVGRNQPNYDVLLQLANMFEVSIDYLIGKKDY